MMVVVVVVVIIEVVVVIVEKMYVQQHFNTGKHHTTQKYLKRFNVISNMMPALCSIDCEVYRIEQKVKKGQHTFMDVSKK